MWNTLKLFIRSLKRNSIISIITIGGYAISMAVIAILCLFIVSEKSVNKSFPNAKDIYRIKRGENTASVPETLLADVKEKLPGVEKMCIYSIGEVLYKFEDKKAVAKLIATNDDLLDIFSFEFVYQSVDPTLLAKDNIILTRQFSERLYGDKNPVGEMLEVNNEMLNIVAVVTDPPQNSSIVFDGITNIEMAVSKSELGHNEEQHNMLGAFVLLNDKMDPDVVNSNISGMLNHWQAFKNDKLSLQPFREVYFDNQMDDNLLHANADMIYLLSCIAVAILFMTIFNYVNLTISRGYDRLNEIGIKKATGAGRMSIFKQFITESLFLCLFAMILALFIAFLIAPLFSEILGKKIAIIELFLQTQTLLIGILIFLLVGIISGYYPALVISDISPIQIINRQKTLRKGSNKPGIIAVQFIITIILITSLLFINAQLKFVKNKNLGFDKDQLIKLHLNGDSQQKWEVLKSKLTANSSIVSVSATLGTPMDIRGISDGTFKDGGDKNVVDMQIIGVDEDFNHAFDISLLEGRNIRSSDSNVCLINEHLYNFLEWNDFAGKRVFGSTVIGVVKDFHHLNLHSKIGHLQLTNLSNLGPGVPSALNIKISGDISQNLEFIRKTFNEVEPGTPVRYQFYDDWLQSFYQKEENQANAVKLFTVIAIVISCLGLIGLVENTTNKRVKEIGIRKVNGAKVWEVMTMLNRDFIKWVVIAFVLATPIGWFLMNKWLENFAYKTELSWWIFALAGLLALGIALLTVSWQSWKAATRNPVEALRYE